MMMTSSTNSPVNSAIRRSLTACSSYEGWLIFLSCFLVYFFLNGRILTSGDSVPNTLIALNWLINHTLNLDNFRNQHFFKVVGQIPYFFVETRKGHLTSLYPIGSAIITFPIYICFCFVLVITTLFFHPVDITSAAFEPQRLLFEKIAATTVTAASVVIFYFATRLKFDRSVAIISTFIYAFATETWVISSQAPWQHGSTNLVLVSILFALLKVNKTEGRDKSTLLLVAGILSGFLLGIRPTNLVFLAAIAVYSAFTYRRQSLFFFLGLPSALLTISWNLYYFGTLLGGYESISSIYSFTLKQLFEGFLSLTISPSRGLLVFSPIVLYAIPGIYQVFKLRSNKDEKLIICLVFSCSILFIQYCFFKVWYGGFTYGPRFLTDILPTVCFLINYSIAATLYAITQRRRALWSKNTIVFLVAVLFSVCVQAIGAFGTESWDAIPLSVDTIYFQSQSTWRFWTLRDSQIERNAQSLFFQITKPTQASNYIQGLKGRILQIRNEQEQQISSPLLVLPNSSAVLKTEVKNTGMSQWLGYETGALKGEVRVRVRLLNLQNQTLSDSRLFVSGRPKHNETASALGEVIFPKAAGTYRLVFDLICEGIGELEDVEGRSIQEITAKVKASN